MLSEDRGLADALSAALGNVSINLFRLDINAGLPYEALMTSIDVIIIDEGVNWDAALATAQRIHRISPVGMVLLMNRPQREARLEALALGIDHVLAKPVDTAELAVILRNLGRFSDQVETALRRQDGNDLWILDHVHWRLIAPAGEQIELSTSEYALLGLMMANPGVQHLRGDLLQLIHAGNARSLDVLISKLRTKIEMQVGRPFPLRTIRGVGYAFVGTNHSSEGHVGR